eukprot:TRINITY_DN4562_c0_g1_i1.p1 TRINITY_DN4562_c0_g1~~TRINITY_DN4562_c0_g1_i1.p1  ORF type:complete len:454 (+),score=78.34 TRINITY_DN4562_c0_g1_i1:147-1508(+)
MLSTVVLVLNLLLVFAHDEQVDGFGDESLQSLDVALENGAGPVQPKSIKNRIKQKKPVGFDIVASSDLDLSQYPAPIRTTPWQPHSTVQDGVYPRFIVIGCQKCGTASLNVYLTALHNFTAPVLKELHGFRGDLARKAIMAGSSGGLARTAQRTMDWYHRKWGTRGLSMKCNATLGRCQGNADPATAPFEITPRYITDMRVPYNMQSLLPNADTLKLVLLLRNPINRTWSSYHQSTKAHMHTNRMFAQMMVNETRLLRACYNGSLGYMTFGSGNTTTIGVANLKACRNPWYMYRKFALCLKEQLVDDPNPWYVKYTLAYDLFLTRFRLSDQTPYEGLIGRGIYVDQLLNYLCAGFDPKSILVITQGELRADPAMVTKRIAQHVGVSWEPARLSAFTDGVHRQSRVKGHTMPVPVFELLKEVFSPHTRLLMELLETNAFVANKTALHAEFRNLL